jgi:hypothetical protein
VGVGERFVANVDIEIAEDSCAVVGDEIWPMDFDDRSEILGVADEVWLVSRTLNLFGRCLTEL